MATAHIRKQLLSKALYLVTPKARLSTAPVPRSVGSVYVDVFDRKRRSKKQSKEFDTLGTWDSRLDVELDTESSIRLGEVIPNIGIERVGVATHQGRRLYQEDRYDIKKIGHNLYYFGIFDGHGGDKCAEYCQKYMWRHVQHCVERENGGKTSHDMEKAIDKAFHDVNKSFDRWYHSKKEHKSEKVSSGSTATVCLLQDHHMMYIGHCGDSRAILCRDNQAKCLTKDHDPSDPREMERIMRSGGNVTSDSIGRTLVNNRLAMSRSIGDLELKDKGVVCRPDIIAMPVKHGKDGFLAIISDGITYVMQDQEIVECILRCEDAKEAAVRLVDQALLYSCEDNATSIIIPFGSWGKERDPSTSVFYSFGRNMNNTSRFG